MPTEANTVPAIPTDAGKQLEWVSGGRFEPDLHADADGIGIGQEVVEEVVYRGADLGVSLTAGTTKWS